MPLENTVAQYQINIVRQGAGAADAVKDFQTVDAAAAAVNSGMGVVNTTTATSAAKLREVHEASMLLKGSFHELHAAGMLLGVEMFPRATGAVSGLTGALHAVRAGAALTGASLGTVFATLTTAIISAIQAYRLFENMVGAHHDKELEDKAVVDLMNSALEQRKHLLGDIAQLAARGLLPEAKGQKLTDLLMSEADAAQLSARVTEISKQLRQMFPDEQKDVKALHDLILQMHADNLQGFEKERFEAQLTYQERKAQLADLAVKAGMDFQGVVEQVKVADDWLAQRQLNIDLAEAEREEKKFEKHKMHILSLIQMEDKAARDFAQGFATAFVDFASGTKSAQQAFSEFAKSFLQEVSKMIIETLTLRVIGSIFGWTGSAVPSAVSMFSSGGTTTSSAPTFTPISTPKALSGSGGAPGASQVHIILDPGLKASIVNQAINGSEVRIIQRAHQNGPVRDAIKKAAA